MKLLTFVISIFFIGSCGPTIYKANNLSSSKASVRSLAILPFNVSLDLKRLPKGVSSANLKESQQKSGYNIQSSAYSWFLKKQKKYSVTFQDVDKTNSLLRKANIAYDSLDLQDKGELCKLLGTDGIISGTALMSKPMSEGAAVALAVLVGAWGATNKTSTIISIHDTSGGLLWKYDWTTKGSVFTTSDGLTKALLKDASHRFPFKKWPCIFLTCDSGGCFS